jgi:hypothetical protein
LSCPVSHFVNYKNRNYCEFHVFEIFYHLTREMLSFKCKILRKWEILANRVSRSAPVWMTISGFINFGALKTKLIYCSLKQNLKKLLKTIIFVKKSKFSEYFNGYYNFVSKTDNGFVFKGPKFINSENFIQIRVLSETPVYHFLRIPHLKSLEFGVSF